MTSRDFAYWLQGFLELSTEGYPSALEKGLTGSQTSCIRNHLNMVFKHEIDPSHGELEHQKKLAELHKQIKPGILYEPLHPFPGTVINC